MNLVRASRPSANRAGAPSILRNAVGIGLALGVATLGCHVFSPGLSQREASGYSSPDGASPGLDSSAEESALPVGVQGPLYGPASTMGCSDGTREGFRDLLRWPSIAGCAGGWQNPGLPTSLSPPPSRPCHGEAGNSSLNPDGLLCSVADLCADGWHLCSDGKEVAGLSGSGCEDILPPGERGFFVAMVGASADGVCALGAHNDLHGCGNLGLPESDRCPPFTRRMGFADCDATGVWKCGTSAQNVDESTAVTKSSQELGGALCCKD